MPIIVDFTKDEMCQAIAEAIENAFKAKEAQGSTKMLTRDEVCEICHISKPTFHAWVNNGTLQIVKIGRRTYVRPESLESAMQVKKVYQFKHQG